MKKRILALLLAVCVACSMLILPASASGSNTAVQTAVTLGGLTSDQTANLAAPLTRGALTKLMVAFSAYRESAKTQGSTGTLFSDVGSGRKIGIPDASVHYRAGTVEEADGRVDENYTGNELRG